MRLTIFWRVILAQSAPIALMIAVSLYTVSQLHTLVALSTDILSTDTAAIELDKRLLRTFLMQLRHAEKYMLLQDKVFYGYFTQAHSDFVSLLEQIISAVRSADEQERLAQLKDVQARYVAGLSTALNRKSAWTQEKTELSEKVITLINDVIRLHEDRIARKTTDARDQAATAAGMVYWLSLSGISVAVFLAYAHARRLSRPLKVLAQGLRRVGQGEFPLTLTVRAPREIHELTQAFNGMATALAELDTMKADFIAHVSHELRTPMTGLREGTALLLEQVPGPLSLRQRQILDVMQHHCERLWHHIASMLDLSKMEAGMMHYERMPCDLAALITRSLDAVRLLAQKKQLQVDVHGAACMPPVWLDAERIQQVLENLLSNAVKFTPPGGTVTISTTLQGEATPQGQCVEVRVSDTGAGIPEEDAERIFDKFYQSAYHRDSQYVGTGLGLAIARRIVEGHGGGIRVESHAGQGATFILTLPVAAPQPQLGETARHGWYQGAPDGV